MRRDQSFSFKEFNPKSLSPIHAEQVQLVLEECEKMRKINRLASRGYSATKTMRMWTKFPVFFAFHPTFKEFFSTEADGAGRDLDLRMLAAGLLRTFGWNFYCVDHP